jgi:hypothetical protein
MIQAASERKRSASNSALQASEIGPRATLQAASEQKNAREQRYKLQSIEKGQSQVNYYPAVGIHPLVYIFASDGIQLRSDSYHLIG